MPLLGNPHVQTLLAHFWPSPTLRISSKLLEVPLPDGDRIAAHDSIPPRWRAGDGMVLLVHGLGGCHRSGYMLRLAASLLQSGLRVVRMDLRGVGAGEMLARRTYHGGCSDDVRALAAHLHCQAPSSGLILVGMSLGGNIVLKLAGEAATHPVRGLKAVAAVGPPIDMVRCAAMLARNRLYDQYYVRQLVKQVKKHQRHFAGRRSHFPARLTLREFDELYTAPRWGFADAMDYYRRASALPVLDQLQVPAFILTARDDPFIAVEPFQELRPSPKTEVHIMAHGGHLGFLGRDGAGGIRWAERRVIDWISARGPAARS